MSQLARTYAEILSNSLQDVRLTEIKVEGRPGTLDDHYLDFADPSDSGVRHSISLGTLLRLAVEKENTDEVIEDAEDVAEEGD